ncbi:HAMP domain-containing protein [Lachnospiraceae bacterium]|nr:HAMP domain-containing protein [Lachnospiraceae bacterium]
MRYRRKGLYSVSVKVGIAVFGTCLLLVLSIMAVGIYQVKSAISRNYARNAHLVIDLIETTVTWDSFEDYIETAQKTDHALSHEESGEDYVKNLNIIKKVAADAECEYIYIFIPKSDDIIYIMDTDEENPSYMGQHDTYESSGLSAEERQYIKEGRYEFVTRTDNSYGYLMSLFRKIEVRDDVYCYVSVDIQMAHILNEIYSQIGITTVSNLLIAIVCSLLAILYFRKTLVEPIVKIADATGRFTDDEDGNHERNVFNSLVINQKDEIGDLADSLKAMELDMNSKLQEMVRDKDENSS